MKVERVYSKTEVVEGLEVEYFVTKGDLFGIGINETGYDGKVTEDVVYDIFLTQTSAEEFVDMLANHTVLSDSLRDILKDYFVEKMLA